MYSHISVLLSAKKVFLIPHSFSKYNILRGLDNITTKMCSMCSRLCLKQKMSYSTNPTNDSCRFPNYSTSNKVSSINLHQNQTQHQTFSLSLPWLLWLWLYSHLSVWFRGPGVADLLTHSNEMELRWKYLRLKRQQRCDPSARTWYFRETRFDCCQCLTSYTSYLTHFRQIRRSTQWAGRKK